MTTELTQSRRPDAYTLLAFGVGATLGVLVPFGRLIIHAWRYLHS